MSARVKLLPVLFIAVLFACSSEAHADPIIITSGFVTQLPADVPRYSLTGDGFSITSRGGSLVGAHVGCGACLVGSAVNIHSTFVGLDLGFGSGTINGVFYPSLYFRGLLDLDANGITGPRLDPLTRYITVTAPFTLSGTYRGTIQNPDTAGGPLPTVFSTTLSGQGIASIRLIEEMIGGNHFYSFDSVTYTFQATPVPEPTTLLLLGTGLAGAVLKKRKRRSS